MGKKTNKDTKKSNKEDEEFYDPEEVDFEYNPEDFEGAQYLEEDEYNVEEIVDMKVENGKKVYLIKWDGYPHSQNTWEPVEHLTKVLYMVEQFEEEYAKNKSLMNMEKENPRYFGDDEKLIKAFNDIKKKKNRDLNDDQEIILKKRKVNPNDDIEIKEDKRSKSNKDTVKESKSSTKDGKTSVKEKAAPPPEEDLIQEITMYKEDLTQSKKKKERKLKSLAKGTENVDEDMNDWLNPVESVQFPDTDKSTQETKTIPEVKPAISDTKLKEPKENKQQAPPKETPKEIPKQVVKEASKEVPKEIPKEIPKEVPKETPKKDVPKEVSKVPKEVIKEVTKEVPKETPKQVSKEVPKETPKEAPKQVSKEIPQEVPKEISKETPKRVEQVPEKAKEKEMMDLFIFTKPNESEMVLENIEPTEPEPKEVKPAQFVVNKELGRTKSTEPVAKKAREKNVKVAPRKKDKTGGFRNKDRPKAILSIKPGKNNGLVFMVEWHPRIDGTQPENSLVTNEDMKLNDPYFLIDFYESKMIQINKKEKKRKEKEKAAKLNGAVGLEPMNTENEPVVINKLGEAEVQQQQLEKLTENVFLQKSSEPKSIKSPVSIKDVIEEGKENKGSIKSKQANEIMETIEDVENNNKGNFVEQNTQIVEEPAGQERMEVESTQKTPVFKGGENEENKINSGHIEILLKPKEVVRKSAAAGSVEKMVVEEPPQEQNEAGSEARKSLNKGGEVNRTEKDGSNNNEEQGNLVSVGS